MKKRTHSFIWSGIALVLWVVIGLCVSAKVEDFSNIAVYIVLGILSYTLVSCLILDNNFIGDMIASIFEWGFVNMPGLIFTLDLDGIIWFLTVKLLFWILGILLAIVCGILAIAVGLVVSLFVYPFALYNSYKEKVSSEPSKEENAVFIDCN